jgi:uncharacterized damage-inducible protein DinB
MNEITRIADQLRRSQQGDAWHGPALAELLADVDAAQALQRPSPAAHNIWELVNHITAWQGAAGGAMRGGVMPHLGKADDWPAAGRTEAQWRDAVKRLAKANHALLTALAKFPEQRLDDQLPGRKHSFYFMLHGVIQHNLYHGGQVALLKKLLA